MRIELNKLLVLIKTREVSFSSLYYKIGGVTIRVFLIYLLLNIILIPWYVGNLFVGILGIGTTVLDSRYTLLFLIYIIIMIPNIVIFAIMHFLRNKLKISLKLNLLFFIIFGIVLFYFVFIKTLTLME